MIRVARYAAAFVGSLIIVVIGSVLLAVLGRPIEESAQAVVDPGIDIDDPGIDVDEEDRHL